jgi:hypothetical protein
MKDLILTIIASIILILSLIAMILPIPATSIIIALSLTSLTITSPRARRTIFFLRDKVTIIHKMFVFLEDKIGERIPKVRNALIKTNPKI